MPVKKPYVFVDVETTGGSYYRDRIIEIGLIRVENNEIVSSYSSLINPLTHLPPEITQLTGINPQDLETAPTFNQIKHEVYGLLDNAVFVAHNSSFDYGFVRSELKRHGLEYSNRHLCTVKLSRRLFPQERHHNLDAVISRCQIACANRHRALGDAQAIWNFFQFACHHFGETHVFSHVKELLKTPSLPTSITQDVIKSLPEAPGVYLFYNSDGAPLYIGKSVNLKDRILSHFAAASTSVKERALTDSIHSLHTIPTSGDLHAQLLESHLIKQFQPIYNRQLRHSQQLLAAIQTTSPEGYSQLTIEPANQISDYPLHSIGIFRSKHQAKQKMLALCQEFQLCPKLLQLETKSGPCFNYHLGTCHGACVNQEKPLKYNLRFIEAFAALKLKRWPFPGPIAIHEQFEGLEAIHTINDWQVTHTRVSGYSLPAIYDIRSTSFDYDTYKILARYLLNPKHSHSIHLNRSHISASNS